MSAAQLLPRQNDRKIAQWHVRHEIRSRGLPSRAPKICMCLHPVWMPALRKLMCSALSTLGRWSTGLARQMRSCSRVVLGQRERETWRKVLINAPS
eukprot:15463255-Alexandrium_andersonii.AAC.1